MCVDRFLCQGTGGLQYGMVRVGSLPALLVSSLPVFPFIYFNALSRSGSRLYTTSTACIFCINGVSGKLDIIMWGARKPVGGNGGEGISFWSGSGEWR